MGGRTQLVLDSWIDGDWTGITGNPGKLFVPIHPLAPPVQRSPNVIRRSGLSLLALAFDALFVVQHFALYRGRRGSGGKEEDAEAAAGAGRGDGGGSLGDRGALLAAEEEDEDDEEASVRVRGTERERLLRPRTDGAGV